MRTFLNFSSYSGIFVTVLLIIGLLLLTVAFSLILTESSVHGILYLMASFALLTEVTLLCKFEFLGLIFIIVYVGAVCVLMLFHIKLIKTFVHRFENFRENLLFVPFIIIGFIIPLIQIITLAMERCEVAKEKILTQEMFELRRQIHLLSQQSHGLRNDFYSENKYFTNYTDWFGMIERVDTTKLLGYLIFDFEFMCLIFGGLVLLVAMIGTIFLTLRIRKEKKFQKLDEQIFKDISKSVFFWKNKKKKNKY